MIIENENNDSGVDSEVSFEDKVKQFQQNPDNFSYEAKVDLLDEIMKRMDSSEASIDDLASDVKLGTRLIKELKAKLAEVETEVKDAFKDLEDDNTTV